MKLCVTTVVKSHTSASGRSLFSQKDTSSEQITSGQTYSFTKYSYSMLGKITSLSGELTAGIAGRSTPCFNTSPDAFNIKFTSKERDSETGLDFFGARYVSSAQGRFTSPDWSTKPQPVPYADLTNPQSLNLYAYIF